MADRDPVKRVEFATMGGRAKHQNDKLRAARFAEHADYIRAIVDAAPPLTELQRARLAALLLSPHRSGESVAA